MNAMVTWTGPVTRHTIATPDELKPKKRAPRPRLHLDVQMKQMGISLTKPQLKYLRSKSENVSAYIRALVEKDMEAK